MDFCKLTEYARYSNELTILSKKLAAVKVLDLSYESDFSGFVDLSVLLKDGRVWSYQYYYGSCSGCDDWEDRKLTSEEIVDEMERESTFFDSIEQYRAFDRLRKSKPLRKSKS
jgi:hypothetical protein